MKKLLLLMCIVFIKTVAQAQTTPGISLNGYPYKDIITMRDAYNISNANLPKPTSVWFSKSVIKNMLTLLKTEKAPNGSAPDGIRIYFGYANNQITVILLSTYAFGTDSDVSSETYHQDYYEHDSNNILFKTPLVNGYVLSATTSAGNGGALLYQDCGSPCPDDTNCDSGGIHYIKRLFGQGMVTNLRTTTTSISTKSEWFDLDMFDAVNRENNYDGIRIYLGKHGTGDPTPEVRNREAFIVVTTKGATPDSQTDNFDCTSAKAYLKNFKSLKEKKNRSHRTKKITPISYTPFFNGQDNGEICPTHCPGTTLQ